MMMNILPISPASPVVIDDKLMTKKQVAERLAVSTRTIDRIVSMRRLEKVFLGASSRFRKSDIDRIIAKGF